MGRVAHQLMWEGALRAKYGIPAGVPVEFEYVGSGKAGEKMLYPIGIKGYGLASETQLKNIFETEQVSQEELRGKEYAKYHEQLKSQVQAATGEYREPTISEWKGQEFLLPRAGGQQYVSTMQGIAQIVPSPKADATIPSILQPMTTQQKLMQGQQYFSQISKGITPPTPTEQLLKMSIAPQKQPQLTTFGFSLPSQIGEKITPITTKVVDISRTTKNIGIDIWRTARDVGFIPFTSSFMQPKVYPISPKGRTQIESQFAKGGIFRLGGVITLPIMLQRQGRIEQEQRISSLTQQAKLFETPEYKSFLEGKKEFTPKFEAIYKDYEKTFYQYKTAETISADVSAKWSIGKPAQFIAYKVGRTAGFGAVGIGLGLGSAGAGKLFGLSAKAISTITGGIGLGGLAITETTALLTSMPSPTKKAFKEYPFETIASIGGFAFGFQQGLKTFYPKSVLESKIGKPEYLVRVTEKKPTESKWEITTQTPVETYQGKINIAGLGRGRTFLKGISEEGWQVTKTLSNIDFTYGKIPLKTVNIKASSFGEFSLGGKTLSMGFLKGEGLKMYAGISSGKMIYEGAFGKYTVIKGVTLVGREGEIALTSLEKGMQVDWIMKTPLKKYVSKGLVMEDYPSYIALTKIKSPLAVFKGKITKSSIEESFKWMAREQPFSQLKTYNIPRGQFGNMLWQQVVQKSMPSISPSAISSAISKQEFFTGVSSASMKAAGLITTGKILPVGVLTSQQFPSMKPIQIFNIPLTRQMQTIIPRQELMPRMDLRTIQITSLSAIMPRQALFNIPLITQAVVPRQEIIPRQAIITRQAQIIVPRQEIIPRMMPPIIPLSPLLIPPPFPPQFAFGRGGGSLGKGIVKGRQPKRYTPSLSALFFGIKGKQPRGILTGLEVRPIPKGFSWYKLFKRKR